MVSNHYVYRLEMVELCYEGAVQLPGGVRQTRFTAPSDLMILLTLKQRSKQNIEAEP